MNSNAPDTADLSNPREWPHGWPGAEVTVYPNTEAREGVIGPQPWVKVSYSDKLVQWYPFPLAISVLDRLTREDV